MNTFEEYLEFARANGIDVTDLNALGDQPEFHEVDGEEGEFDPFFVEMPEEDGVVATSNKKLAIFLHGFKPTGGRAPFTQEQANRGDYADYTRFFNALKRRLPGYACFITAYDTHQSFHISGVNIANFFKTLGDRYDLTKTIIVGYSMGGLVGRTICMHGLPFAKLYTTCTPHKGVLPYLLGNIAGQGFFFFNKGASSMNPWSADLRRLNNSDGRYLSKYYCHGINYTDARPPNFWKNDDTITGCNEATMVGRRVAYRWATHIGLLNTIDSFPGTDLPMPFQPHLRGYADIKEWGSDRWAPQEFVNKVSGV
ncbi:MAG: alpha/beta hydrolase [Pseudomonadota bacterium]